MLMWITQLDSESELRHQMGLQILNYMMRALKVVMGRDAVKEVIRRKVTWFTRLDPESVLCHPRVYKFLQGDEFQSLGHNQNKKIH
nr:hypothetical protein [Tanacetum cinerariifolium]